VDECDRQLGVAMRVTGIRLAHDQEGVMAQDPTEEQRRGV
jgi:hypothetical protein